MVVTQLYESYRLDANKYVETPVEPPESSNDHVQNGSESTNVQTLVSNLTEDVLPLDLLLDTTQQSHTSLVQTISLAREDLYCSSTASDFEDATVAGSEI